MKPAAFDYARPATLEDAFDLLGRGDISVKVLAGGQSLGPMLNLRLGTAGPAGRHHAASPSSPGSRRTTDGRHCSAPASTHAAIENGRVPDVHRGRAAGGRPGASLIAPCARRGTIGGSLAHADPAADWISCLSTALGAEIGRSHGRFGGRRRLAVARHSWCGVFETALEAGEVLEAVRVPKRLGAGRALGLLQGLNRKTGEFAHAIGAVLARSVNALVCRAVAGATEVPAHRHRATPRPLVRAVRYRAAAACSCFDATAAGKMLVDRADRGYSRGPADSPGGRPANARSGPWCNDGMQTITLTVNGKAVTAAVEPRTHLADFLREQLLLTGTHLGCEHGVCGACTVSIDGQIARVLYQLGGRLRRRRGCAPSKVSTRTR